MTSTSVALVMRTNVHGKSIPKEFLSKLTVYITELFCTESKYVTAELHTDVMMIRAGSTDPMMNIDLHHNSNKVNQNVKTAMATGIAQFMSTNAKLPEDRVLVLFFDTRKCN